MRNARWGRRLGTLAVIGIVGACASSTVATTQADLRINGTFQGIQDGTSGGVSFENEQIVFLLVETGDSVVGTYDVSGIGGGEFRASLNRLTTGLFADFEMEQTSPCPGTYSGNLEAQQGIRGTGERVVALSGSYDGTDCDGAVDAAFFVQN